jgi:5-aminopentanamidase
VKIAIWQTSGIPGDKPANLAALAQAANAASAAGAELLLCPECWLAGYNILEDCHVLAETMDGPSAIRIAEIAQQHGIAIVYGYAERDAGSGDIYNVAHAIGPDGATLGHYRKTHLFGAFEHQLYRKGDGFAPPFSFAGWKIGMLICYDVEFPEAVRSLALAGADLILIPTALTEEYASVPGFIVPARSVENQIFVAYCNHSGVENGLQFLGRSCVTGPDGQAVISAGRGDALLIADIHHRTLQEAAATFPYRKDRRPELYGAVNRLPGV